MSFTKENFVDRHIGPREEDVKEMLSVVGVNSIKELIDKTVPENIKSSETLKVGEALTEAEYLKHIKAKADKNKVFKSYIGMGYYGTQVPSVNLRNILENPGWYTAYTPYQAEISQGRLEALLNFQTMIVDLTGMDIANASLLDEGTAAAEAMLMAYHSMSRAKQKSGVKKFFVDQYVFPQTKSVLSTRANAIGIELVEGDYNQIDLDDSYFGAIVQYPNSNGEIIDYQNFASVAKENEVVVVAAADIMSLVLLNSPASWGADVVVGATQRFGVPMGYGGPHAAYFACKEEYKRNVPGRIIGVSIDAQGNRALRMALQTREQHIKRAKATSNICTAQALLAVMASMYAVYHGPKGLRNIAQNIHLKTNILADGLKDLGVNVITQNYFDTIAIKGTDIEQLKLASESKNINFGYFKDTIFISLDETTTIENVEEILEIFAEIYGGEVDLKEGKIVIQDRFLRNDEILTEEVFNIFHSETEMMRYLKRLENKDLSLTHSMISLGSCTMKLNAASEMIPITWPEFANLHPFAPVDQAEGFHEVFEELDKDLSNITGFAKVSLQPNSGAQGEYAGLMVIKAYHEDRGDHHRDICLIPSSAHGTNPASAVMAGMKVVVVKCDDNGNIDIEDLKEKAEKHKEQLSALMVTYPSTHGVYEEGIIEITSIVHENGGQVYMDGANMNAQVGITSPGKIGADVCHLNLHKTFAIPHGGGGPGVGPIGVAKHLVPYLPSNPVIKIGSEKAISAISSAPYGSALVDLISYGYIKMLGSDGLRKSTELAILNANYMKARLSEGYNILYTGKNGTVAHEMILDCRGFKKTAQIEVVDIAKRLIDYGFHAPTVSFPVAGTLMIEPTESESKAELDRFCDAMLSIREEIAKIERAETIAEKSVLKNAPHTAKVVTSDDWSYSYTRKEAAYPMDYLYDTKFWVSVARVNDAYGDRNLICTCAPIEDYIEAV